MKKDILLILAALTISASAQVEIAFPYSETADHIYERHSAAWDTPVAKPPNWYYNRNSVAESQEALRDFYGSKYVVRPVEVVKPESEPGFSDIPPTPFRVNTER